MISTVRWRRAEILSARGRSGAEWAPIPMFMRLLHMLVRLEDEPLYVLPHEAGLSSFPGDTMGSGV